LNSNPRVGTDTSGLGFWGWSQAGVVITDTSKIQGLPEADPLAVRRADSASYSLGYISFKRLTDSLNTIPRVSAAADTTGYFARYGGVMVESDPLSVKKADSANYAAGYITFKRLTDTLNANPRVGTDTSGLGFWSWSQAPEEDPLAVKKADSASYSLGYITFKRLTDTLNANPRGGGTSTDTSGNGDWYYKLPKESFDNINGTRDSSRTWKTIVSITGTAVTSVDSATPGRYRYSVADTSGKGFWNFSETDPTAVKKADSLLANGGYPTTTSLERSIRDSLDKESIGGRLLIPSKISGTPENEGYVLKYSGGVAQWEPSTGGGDMSRTDSNKVTSGGFSTVTATRTEVKDTMATVRGGTATWNIPPAMLDTNLVTIFAANDTNGLSVTTIAGDILFITATTVFGNTSSETQMALRYAGAVQDLKIIKNGATADRLPVTMQATLIPGATTQTVSVTKGPGLLYGTPQCKITVLRIRRN